MIINYLALAIALLLSAVAAYYSIVGLAVIFASALIPVIIMASSLEAGKVVATSWLYRNWHTAPKIIKYYLTVAVVILMFITSMGIFGFLSKAHLEQAVVGGDSISKLAVYDERIRTSKENIELNRKALKQMDEAVDQVMGRSSDEKGADKAVAIRRSQQKERQRIQSEIQAEQTTISQLNQERAPIAAEVRKVEAEVGPIKYIAALVYGDNPDQNVMEKAVRWVIISLVIVFDPLAIMLLLAANHSLTRKEPESQPLYVWEDTEKPTPEELQPEPTKPLTEDEKWLASFNHSESIKDYGNCFKCGTKIIYAKGIGPHCPNTQCEITDNIANPDKHIETPLPPEQPPTPPPQKEGWSPRWYQKARGLIDKKKQGIIEISKDSIVDMK